MGPGYSVSLQGRAGRQRTVLEPLDNVPALTRAAPKPRGHGVSASMKWSGPRLGRRGQNIQMLVSVVSRILHLPHHATNPSPDLGPLQLPIRLYNCVLRFTVNFSPVISP